MSEKPIGSTREIGSNVIEVTLRLGAGHLQSIHVRGADAGVEVPAQDSKYVVG